MLSGGCPEFQSLRVYWANGTPNAERVKADMLREWIREPPAVPGADGWETQAAGHGQDDQEPG